MSDSYLRVDLLADVECRLPRMVTELESLVAVESPTSDVVALRHCADMLTAIGTNLLGKAPHKIDEGNRRQLVWRFGPEPRILLVGHYDTVFEIGTLRRFPFRVDGDRAFGPGICDMKGGIIIALHALSVLIERYGAEALDGVWLYFNPDEETGSPSSIATLESIAAKAKVALVFENAAENGQIKTVRSGWCVYHVSVTGRAAHAGCAPEDGVNAIVELANQIERIAALADIDSNTIVTPSVVQGGTVVNVVPENARVSIDVRFRHYGERQRIWDALHALVPRHPGAKIEVECSADLPALSGSSSLALYELASAVWSDLGLGILADIAVGGMSDANSLAALGLEVIDGLGVAGGGDHSEREWASLPSLVERVALTVGMIEEMLQLGNWGGLVSSDGPLCLA